MKQGSGMVWMVIFTPEPDPRYLRPRWGCFDVLPPEAYLHRASHYWHWTFHVKQAQTDELTRLARQQPPRTPWPCVTSGAAVMPLMEEVSRDDLG